jgi:formate hydrogenlyase subunit 3/multisubunit Na+/H+ antiporter MnhD subunit
MPAASVLAPSALLAAAAAVGWALERLGVPASRWLAAGAAWLALVALLATWWATGRATLELNLPGTVGGAPPALRLDAIGVAFGLVVLLPTALLFTFQRRGPAEASVAALAASASLLVSAAGSLLLTAVALGTCASLVLVALRQEEDRPATAYLVSLSVAGLLLLWAGVVLELTGGTSVYSAAPVTALRVPVFLLLAGAGLLCSGLLPWPSWLPAMWDRERLEAGPLAIALLGPIGFLLLSRAYLLGAGHWPSPVLNLALGAVGVAAAAAAALRAQAAAGRLAFLGEAVPLGGGLALLALSLGTPFGVSAALLTLAGSALIVGLAPLLPAGRWPPAVLGAAVILGVPPALIFGGRLLAIQAAAEAGDAFGFLGLLGAASWLLALAAAARLPALSSGGEEERAGDRFGVYAVLVLALAGGLAAGVLETLLGLPLAAEVVGAPGAAVSGGYFAVVSASGGWAAFTLGVPLTLLAVAVAVLSRPAWIRWAARPVAVMPAPAPLVRLPAWPLRRRAKRAAGGVQLPANYRDLLRPSTLEAAAAASPPWVWGAITLALIVIVTR